MKYEKYVSLIRKLEIEAEKNRTRYELKVFFLAWLGYGYFGTLLGVLTVIPLLCIGALIANPEAFLKALLWVPKLLWFLIPFGLMYVGVFVGVVKAIFAKCPEPTGRRLVPSDAPKLFAFVHSTCERLDAKQPAGILVSDNFNASIVTAPRLGIFGIKTYMQLGLPVMKALSPEQFKAVLVHEIGHISGRHGGFGKWAYQLHEAWNRFLASQELNENKFSSLYDRFVKWFFPFFGAYSLVLMREHEKEADQYAVEVAGSAALGGALILLRTNATALDESFWPTVHKENQASPEPATDLFSRMLSFVGFIDPVLEKETLEKAIQVPTDLDDSHPSLADRLRKIGYWDGIGLPAVPDATIENAADFYLGEQLGKFLSEFEVLWSDEVAKTWRQRFDHFQASRDRMAELDSKEGDEALSGEDLLERAALVAEQQGNKEAIPTLQRALDLAPENPEINYALGCLLLQQDDESGFNLIERSMEFDRKWEYVASNALFQYLRSKGRLDEAAKYASAMETRSAEAEHAKYERYDAGPNDEYLPHNFDIAIVEEIVRKLRYYEEISAIFLVNKDVRYFKEIDFPVLFIEMRKRSLLGGGGDLKPSDLLAAIRKRLDGIEIGYIGTLSGEHSKTKTKLDQVPGALIFDRSATPET